MPGPDVGKALKKQYALRAGELAWIEAPPKTMNRRSRDRDSFLAGAEERVARACELREALSHIAYVIRMYDVGWTPEEAKPIRPKAKKERAAQQTFTGAALDVYREAEQMLTIAETVEIIARRYDYDIATVVARQRLHTAVSNGTRTYRHLLVHDGRKPRRWGLTSRWPGGPSGECQPS